MSFSARDTHEQDLCIRVFRGPLMTGRQRFALVVHRVHRARNPLRHRLSEARKVRGIRATPAACRKGGQGYVCLG